MPSNIGQNDEPKVNFPTLVFLALLSSLVRPRSKHQTC